MPRKPNYRFERFERERLKAEKKAARMQAKADRRAEKKGDNLEGDAVVEETAVDATGDSPQKTD